MPTRRRKGEGGKKTEGKRQEAEEGKEGRNGGRKDVREEDVGIC